MRFFRIKQFLCHAVLKAQPSLAWVVHREERTSRAPSRSVRSDRAEIPIVTLNIGGRNTNPLEFILEGDDSDIGQQVVQMGRRAQEAMVDAKCGPAAMPHAERALVNKILTSIYGQIR